MVELDGTAVGKGLLHQAAQSSQLIGLPAVKIAALPGNQMGTQGDDRHRGQGGQGEQWA